MNEYESGLKLMYFGPVLTEKPVVSVAMITYNHQVFVQQAIKSVFAQYTDWPIELVIGEDCSTDETLDAITNICKDAPISIKIIKGLRNVGMHKNIRRVVDACAGEFVAFLEGDDYWIDKNKLKKQVDALEADKSLSFCFHRVRWEYLSDSIREEINISHGTAWPVSPPEIIDFQAIADDIFIQTASVVYRRVFLPSLPEWFEQLPGADWAIFLMLISKGGVTFLPEVMSAYQLHPGGATAKGRLDPIGGRRGMILMFKNLNEIVSPSQRNICRKMLIKNYELLAGALENKGDVTAAKRALHHSIWQSLKGGDLRYRAIAWYFRLGFPRVHKFLVRRLKREF